MTNEIKVGSLAHRLLSMLASKGNMTAAMMKKTGAFVGKTLTDIESTLSGELTFHAMVSKDADECYCLTQKGLDKKIELGNTDKLFKAPRKTVLSQQNDLFSRGVYMGDELRSTCMRRGAYDAYNLPSRTAEGRIYRKVML